VELGLRTTLCKGAGDVCWIWLCAWGGVAALLQPAIATPLRAEAREFVPTEKARTTSPVMEEPDEPLAPRRLQMR
jgi:hypothetical protein